MMRKSDLDPDPLRQFENWFGEALKAGETLPEATALATASPDGVPSVRMVLFKGLGDAGLEFFTNFNSRKCLEMNANPRAAMVFWWQKLHRQVRLEGTVQKLDAKRSDEYFRTRPRRSQIGAWASRQSQVIADREELEKRLGEYDLKFSGRGVPQPAFWGGYQLIPSTVEFWQEHGRRTARNSQLLRPKGILIFFRSTSSYSFGRCANFIYSCLRSGYPVCNLFDLQRKSNEFHVLGAFPVDKVMGGEEKTVPNQLEQKCKILEQKLQQCEEKFVRFFHAAANALAITTIDEGLILDVNESFAALAGYSREELLGSSTKAMGLWVHPEQREAAIRQLLEKRRISELEVTLRSKNGKLHTLLF
jgi:pyridoxamine 5'-phosphate oxidase